MCVTTNKVVLPTDGKKNIYDEVQQFRSWLCQGVCGSFLIKQKIFPVHNISEEQFKFEKI